MYSPFTRKKLIIMLVFSLVFIIAGCEEETPGNDDTPEKEALDPGYGIDAEVSHFETLQREGDAYDLSNISYNEESEVLDYSDDNRELADTSDLSSEDVIDIPSKGIKDYLESFYSIESPITYGDVKSIEHLNLTAQGIKSIAGIEYFTGLKILGLGSNRALTSIKGVEALNNLEMLNIANTSVKNIEYANSSIEEIYASYTFLDIDEAMLTRILDNYRMLNLLDLSNTNLKVDKDIVEHWEAIANTPRSVVLKVDYKQLDYESVGFGTFWEIEDQGVSWQHERIEVEVPFHENANMEMSSVNSFFVDISDESYDDTLIDTFEILDQAIGVEKTNTELEAIVLIYDYFLKNRTVSDSGSHYVLDAYNNEPVTKTTALEAMSLYYQYRDLPVFTIRYGLQDFNEENTEAVNTLDVLYKGRAYALGGFGYFMVGSPNAQHHMEDVFNSENSPFGPSLSEIRKRYSRHDFKRSVLREHAENLNIDLELD